MRAIPFVLIFIICCPLWTFARQGTSDDLREMDSLKSVVWSLSKEDQLDILADLASTEEDPDSIFKYSDLLYNLAVQDSSYSYLWDAFLQKGNAYGFEGNFPKALEMYLKSLEMAQKINSKAFLANSYFAIAGNFRDTKNEKSAISYYQDGINILMEGELTENDSLYLATGTYNLGDFYLKSGKIDSAELLIQNSQDIFEKLKMYDYEPYLLGSFGIIEANRGNDQEAENLLNRAIGIFEDYYDFSNISELLRFASAVYLSQNEFQKSLRYADRSLILAKEYDLGKELSESNLLLSEIYKKLDDPENALKYYETHISYRDSLNNLATIRDIYDQQTEFLVAQEQTKRTIAELQAKRRSMLLYGAIVLLILAGLLIRAIFKRFKLEKETKEIIQTEKKRSDDLLLNILPVEIADELMAEGKVKAQKFDEVTVLFSDFASFTSLAESIPAEQLVKSIDFYFKEFDRISEKYDLEKIKTIGDSYMTAGGIPDRKEGNAQDVAKAAIEMMEFTKSEKPADIVHFEMRIGIHTGPVVAGIVGLKKWQYDIWGDTVNVASRMESNSEEGKINISETTYEILKDKYSCEFRGSVEVKNRGVWKMYFLNEA